MHAVVYFLSHVKQVELLNLFTLYMRVDTWVHNIPPFGFQELGVTVTHSNTEVVSGSDVVFVAVKPHLVAPVLNEISVHVTGRHIIVSVAAGVTLATLEQVSVSGVTVSQKQNCGFALVSS